PSQILARLRAEWALAALLPDRPDQARPIIEAVDPVLFPWWREYALARLELASGLHKQAKDRLIQLWRAMPWHTNLSLTLHDLLHPVPPDPAALERHKVAVLLYSWNKGEVLAQTLDSLAASNIGPARVFVLDNGSTDSTPDLLQRTFEQWESLRPGSLYIETLPVNVGAPAARNWLLSLDKVKECGYAAFLDDDLLLPEDWLVRLLSAAETSPQAGAVGCMVTDHIAPFSLQAADFHLLHPDTPAASFADSAEHVHVLQNATGSRDHPLFAYTRPCLSVTGCCHLVSMRAIEQAGAFDVRFTPSQFDDLERDMRSCLASMPTLYTGALQVKHMQHSSLKQADSPAKTAHIFANKAKLEAKYAHEDLLKLHEWNLGVVWEDLLGKVKKLEADVNVVEGKGKPF
ncbi:MAG: glycosyltransferase, partial [Desulfovibrio sp.]